MHITAQKDHFSRAVVRAIAAAAGVDASVPPHDQNSKDIEFTAPDVGGVAGGQLAAQLKCTHTVDTAAESFTYDLDVKDYDRLRVEREKLYVPRVLIVVDVPEDPDDWLLSEREQMVLKRCAYWTSLTGLPPTINTSTVAVTIPTEQVFDVEGLLGNLKPPGEAL
ncbi:MAG TPA: DUF4365 domain-containing protein [Solirubrobacteraceae bacterium]|jgi:Domain of unknown function (DUF4365)|nr:DUF4365 domain-containing protein [Solirubrobacteraceae bacterium]